MAGQPKRKRMIEQLEAMTRAEFGDEPATHLDFADVWLGSGRTLIELADEITTKAWPRPTPASDQPPLPPRDLREKILVDALSKYLHSLEREADEETKGLITRARARGAKAMLEDTLRIADTAVDAQLGNLQVRARQYVAERFDPSLAPKSAGGTTINIGTLMLEALRQPIAQLMPPNAILPAIAHEPDEVTVEATITSEGE